MRNLLLGLAIVAMGGLAGCSGGPRDPAPKPTTKTLSPAATEAPLAELVRQLEERPHRPLGGSVVVDAGARPTVTPAGNGRWQTMVIRDEDESPWAAGTYRLEVACLGVGSLVAFIGVGGAAQIRQLAPCGSDVGIDHVTVAVPRAASKGTVVITPVGETRAAVAYQVLKE